MNARSFGLFAVLFALLAYSYLRPPDLEIETCRKQGLNCTDRVVQVSHLLVGNLLPDLLTRPFYAFFPGLYWAFAPLHTHRWDWCWPAASPAQSEGITYEQSQNTGRYRQPGNTGFLDQ